MNMHLYTEAKSLALEAWEESNHNLDEALDFLHQACDGHEVAIYYGKAIEFCWAQDTNDGEDYLEDCGSIVQEGDTFGSIALRIAHATLLVAAQNVLNEISEESSQ